MRTFLVGLVLVASAQAVNVAKIAAVTTIGINVLEAPATIRKAKAAIKKIRFRKKKTT